jgi:2-methylaconitate cis-trans-isomerase PrpF
MRQTEGVRPESRVDADLRRVPCTVVRGGTSKGVLFRERDIPADPAERERLILNVMGSPDPRQVDGLGGADTLTSKAAVVGPSADSDVDVDYTFGQVSVDEAHVDFEGNCGHISAAAGYFAVEAGYVEPDEPVTRVTMRNTGTNARMVVEVPVENGRSQSTGEFQISGVPRPGARVNVGIVRPGGGKTGATLPTGSPRDEARIDGQTIRCSLVDAGNPCLFVRATDLGLTGTESPDDVDTDEELLDAVEALRTEFAVESGLAESERVARETNTLLPLVVFVAEPTDYTAFGGERVPADDISLVARMVFNRRLHKAYAGTGSVCTGVASQIDGTVVSEVARSTDPAGGRQRLTIGHTSGTMDSLVDRDDDGDVREVLFRRTARRLMDGTAYTHGE